MSKPPYAAIAARLLRDAPTASRPGAAALQRSLSTIERAQSARRRKVRWQRAALGVALAAASVVVVVGARHLAPGAVSTRAGEAKISVSALQGSGASVVDLAEKRAVLRAGLELAAGSRIETTDGGTAALRLSTGTLLTIDGQSRVTLEARGTLQHFSLQSGGLDARVAKLEPGARFVVQTPDAEIEVRGTQFHLSVLEQPEPCAPLARTRLVVREGVVEVRSSTGVVRVGAGERWPSSCEERVVDVKLPQPAPAVALDADARHGTRPPAPPPAPAAVALQVPGTRPATAAFEPPEHASGSALSEQTELFAAASKAARAGDSVKALTLYSKLIEAYPSSGLRENAIAERMRLLRQGSPAAARREASLYLSLYPNGFGKPEAERILASP